MYHGLCLRQERCDVLLTYVNPRHDERKWAADVHRQVALTVQLVPSELPRKQGHVLDLWSKVTCIQTIHKMILEF